MCTLIENVASEAAYRTSQAEMMSNPNPMTGPCTAAITGKGQRSGALMDRWNERINFRVKYAVRAGSEPKFSDSAKLPTVNPRHKHSGYIVSVKSHIRYLQ